MKIAVVGDTHFGAVFGLGKPNSKGGNTRIDDYERTFDFIINYCVENDIKVLIQTGDLFEKRKPDPSSLLAADRSLRKLSANGIRTYVIMGNHDYVRFPGGFSSSLEVIPANNYDKVTIYTKPQAPTVEIDGEEVNLILVPFQDKRAFFVKNEDGDSKPATTEQASILVEEKIKEMIDSVDSSKPTIAVGHNFYYEGSYNIYGGSEILVRPEAFKGCNAVMMGHLHQFRVVKTYDPTVVYTGSLERTNFGEANSNKYLTVYDSVLDKCEFVELPCKDLFDLTIDLSSSDAEKFYSDLDDKLSNLEIEGSIVRVKVMIKEVLSNIISLSDIQKRIKAKKPDYISKVFLEPIKERLKRNIEILEEESDFSILKKFISDQSLSSESLQKEIIKAAKEIMEA